LIGSAALPKDDNKSTTTNPGSTNDTNANNGTGKNRDLFTGVGGTALSVALANGKAAEKARDAALALVTTLEQALAENHDTLIQKTKEYAGARFAAQRVTVVEAKLEGAEDTIRSLKEALSQAEKRALGFQVFCVNIYVHIAIIKPGHFYSCLFLCYFMIYSNPAGLHVMSLPLLLTLFFIFPMNCRLTPWLLQTVRPCLR
jgi:hypothetical protein